MRIEQERCLDEFLTLQSPDNAYNLVLSCKDYIINICKSWYEPNLSEREKIREVMCEIFLILLEKFDASKIKFKASLFSYIHHRLKQLLFPRGRSFLNADKSIEGLVDNSGRYSFTPEKLSITDAVFKSVRANLLAENDEETAFLSFLFIHVYPHFFWASRQLMGVENQSNTLLDRYRKKIQRFNLKLRHSIESNTAFDWKDIFNWTSGERSHLAWKIICISPCELSDTCHKDLELINNWREIVKKEDIAPESDKIAAKNILNSMKRNFLEFTEAPTTVSEEILAWGAHRDILDSILGFDDIPLISSVSEKKIDNYAQSSQSLDKDFLKIADELKMWFTELSQNFHEKKYE